MFGSALRHVILPAIVIAAYPAGVITRMVRASVLDTIGEDHVRMVRALGFSERSVFARFALGTRGARSWPLLALVFAYALVNTFLVEAIFNWPGLGSYAADAIGALDTPAILGVTLFVAIVYVLRQPGRRHRPGHDRPADPGELMSRVPSYPDIETPRGGPRSHPAGSAACPGSSGGTRSSPSAPRSCIAIFLVAVLAPLIATYPEDAGSAVHPLQTLEPPSAQH